MKRNRLYILTLLIVSLVFATGSTYAKQRISDEQREEWLDELREYRHKFFRKELNLNRDQETKFFQVYDRMDAELIKIGEETREMERKTLNNTQATDTEMETVARALFEQKKREAEVELKYFDQFKEILSKRQLLKLKEVERKFNATLLKHAREKRDQRSSRL